MAEDGYEPVLKKSRWCLLKRRENLTDKQRVKLRDLLGYNLNSVLPCYVCRNPRDSTPLTSRYF